MATYVAVTTTNPQSGWQLLAWGPEKNETEQAGWTALNERYGEPFGRVHDIYEDTERKNFAVLGLSTAIRKGVLSRFAWENRFEDEDA